MVTCIHSKSVVINHVVPLTCFWAILVVQLFHGEFLIIPFKCSTAILRWKSSLSFWKSPYLPQRINWNSFDVVVDDARAESPESVCCSHHLLHHPDFSLCSSQLLGLFFISYRYSLTALEILDKFRLSLHLQSKFKHFKRSKGTITNLGCYHPHEGGTNLLWDLSPGVPNLKGWRGFYDKSPPVIQWQ